MARPVAAVTTNTTLDASYSGKDVLVSGAQLDITFGPALTIPDGCDITLVNSDTTHGHRIFGAPFGIGAKLYPGQEISVVTYGGQWHAVNESPRYRLGGTTILYVDNGGDDTNDGLTTSTPLQHIGKAGLVIQQEFDTDQTTAIIAPSINQTFSGAANVLALGGQPTGGNLIQLSPNGNGSFTWINDGPIIVVGDNAELNIALNGLYPNGTFRSMGNQLNAVDSGHVYIHNNGLFDMEGIPTFVGHGTNDSAFFFDGTTGGAAMSNGFNVENTFGYVFVMDEGGGRFTLSGAINPVPILGSSPPINPYVAGLFRISGESELILGTSPAQSGWGAIGASIVSGNALIVTNGISLPGGLVSTQGGRIASTKY